MDREARVCKILRLAGTRCVPRDKKAAQEYRNIKCTSLFLVSISALGRFWQVAVVGII